MISTTDLAQHTLEQIRCQFLLFELEDLLPSLSLSNLTKCFVLGGNDPQLFCSAVPCEYWNVNKYALLVEPC
ncbi:unnamed protein product [Brassica rapa]|uniref:Uncharacterized protein n=2 Tax=Brassica TaxID=3705 RepID=A0A3P5XYW7_BRACM|nr:unnamed protein product [Brassica napus]CAG7861678.1 unnamed protein product [Brassica rapa]CAG7898407.1 unnamed protein product [Brassica rapa]VDC59986.1 unnamed protein product [Brassica rapa]VDD04960.1 unnamed protein product [Brassica rapa]